MAQCGVVPDGNIVWYCISSIGYCTMTSFWIGLRPLVSVTVEMAQNAG